MSFFEGYDLESCSRVDEHGIRWVKECLPDLDFLRTRWKLRRTHPTAEGYLEEYPEDFPWSVFVLKHGQPSRSERYRDVKLRLSTNGFAAAGKCYQNALAASHRIQHRPSESEGLEVKYVEGLAVSPMGTFLHGWVDVGGQSLDLTYPPAYMTTYFGIRMDPVWAESMMAKIGYYGLLHHWDKSRTFLEEAFA